LNSANLFLRLGDGRFFSKLRLAQPALSVVIGLAEPMTDSHNHLKIGHLMGVKR
jgi:hypothetical protein